MSPAAQDPALREPMRPSRRAIARGAAWSVPVIAVGSAAPAMAASPTACPSFPEYETDGWSLVTSGPLVSPDAGARFVSGTFEVTGDPMPFETFTATASHPLAVVNGETYTFQYSWTALTANPNPMTSELQVDGTPVAGSMINTATDGSSGTVTATYVAAATGEVAVSIRMEATDAVGDAPSDDITVGAISVSCGV